MMRIGHGFDVHAFGELRPLIIGGVEVPHHTGLIAHSDGDVALHALTDALLGALALGDIGKLFPDTDMQFRNIDSRILLREAFRLANEKGYRIGNVDVTIIAQAPKMRSYIDAMRAVIAADLQCDIEQVNVKATTTEKLGFTGRGEGIATEAVVLLLKKTGDVMNSFEKIYEQWHLFAKTRDTENLINLYDDHATFESPLVPAILDQESGVLQGRAAILNFLREGTKRRPNQLVRWYRNGSYFIKDDTLIWEYPRQTPEGEQIDILEVMQIHNDKIIHHRIYWGWFGCQRLINSAVKAHPSSC